jgi:hypothetical protein
VHVYQEQMPLMINPIKTAPRQGFLHQVERLPRIAASQLFRFISGGGSRPQIKACERKRFWWKDNLARFSIFGSDGRPKSLVAPHQFIQTPLQRAHGQWAF